jgi:hypothetical protein
LPASSDFVTKDYITLGVAAWGAVLSTIVVTRQLLQARRRIQVQIVQHLNLEEPPDGLREHWRVRVVNVGSRPLQINQVGLIVKTTDMGTGRYTPLPRASTVLSPTRSREAAVTVPKLAVATQARGALAVGVSRGPTCSRTAGRRRSPRPSLPRTTAKVHQMLAVAPIPRVRTPGARSCCAARPRTPATPTASIACRSG